MKKLQIYNLSDFIQKRGENAVQTLLSTFQCPLNPSIEHFLHHNAINFSKQGIAITYLVFLETNDNSRLVGYFSLASKIIHFDKSQISNRVQRLVNKFGEYNQSTNTYSISAPLIAQFGKNFAYNQNQLVTGSELLELALSQVKYIQSLIGGRAIYLECDNNPKLLNFYQSNGYTIFGTRTPLNAITPEHCLYQLVKFTK